MLEEDRITLAELIGSIERALKSGPLGETLPTSTLEHLAAAGVTLDRVFEETS